MDTYSVILRKHTRFSILQKDENTMNKQLMTKYTFFPKHENATSTKHKLQTQKKQIPNTLLEKLIILPEL